MTTVRERIVSAWSARDLPSRWCGRLDFPLLNARGIKVTQATITVSLDHVELHARSRSYGIFARARLGSWLRVRGQPDLAVDDARWMVAGRDVAVRLGGSLHAEPLIVPHDIVEELTLIL
jgi:hypothetical protein